MTGFKRAMRGALLALLAVFPITAYAADLGGNCCADLEERVAELEATTARKGGRKMSLSVYGQVNYALLWVDAPGISNTTVTNNTNSMTRFGFVGESKISSTLSAGYQLEVGTAGAGYTGAAPDELVIRHSAFYLKVAEVGVVWLGKTSAATDGIAEISIANVAVASTMLSLEPLSGTYLMGANLPFDGGRDNVVRFDTRSVAGFTASAAWIANRDDAWDMSLRYKGEFEGVALAAGVGYRHETGVFGDAAKTLVGSASVMHLLSGVFVNGAYGKLDGAVLSGIAFWQDAKAYQVQAGIERKWLDLGKTTAYGEWGRIEQLNGRLDFYGVGLTQSIDAAAMDLYVAYRKYDDADLQTVVAGGIIRF